MLIGIVQNSDLDLIHNWVWCFYCSLIAWDEGMLYDFVSSSTLCLCISAGIAWTKAKPWARRDTHTHTRTHTHTHTHTQYRQTFVKQIYRGNKKNGTLLTIKSAFYNVKDPTSFLCVSNFTNLEWNHCLNIHTIFFKICTCYSCITEIRCTAEIITTLQVN